MESKHSHKNAYENNWKCLWLHLSYLTDKSNSLALFKSMLKAYTSEACYREIGYFMRTQNFTPIKSFLALTMQGVMEHGENLHYTASHEAVYRGMSIPP
jgi:hypothetical protein